jgi:hypothetical protein
LPEPETKRRYHMDENNQEQIPQQEIEQSISQQKPGSQKELTLSELGSLKLAQQRRKILSVCFMTGGIGLIIALLIFGSYVVMQMQTEEKTVFVAPPPPKRTYEPRKLEHKVKVQKRQRSSSRPTMVPRLVAMKKSNMTLPNIKMDPKVINTSFQPKFKSVSGKGIGAGLGTGYGVGGFGSGVNKFDFFGIRGKGDKIAVLVDTSTSMVEEQMGGVKGYMKVKSRVNKVIDALGEGSIFNLIVFADAADALFKKLQISNPKHKKAAKTYLRPFNTEGNWGLATGNITPDGKGLLAQGGTTRLDLALTASFQQGADTILIISDGAPKVMRGITSDEMQAYNNLRSEWEKKNQKKLDVDDSGDEGKMVKVWVPPQKARPAKKGPPKEGEAVDNGSPAVKGHFVMRHHRGNRKRRPKFPVSPPKARYWTLAEFLKHLRLLHEHYYLKKGQKPPVIHCIGYKIDKEGNAFLKAIAKEYKGKYRRVQSIKSR